MPGNEIRIKRIPPDNQQPDAPIVILIHGLFLWSAIMRPMATFLAAHGFECILYDYHTVRKHVPQHGEDLAAFLRHLFSTDPNRRISLVTHSLGGIITRAAVALLADDELRKITRIVQIVPPNKGSDIAKLVCTLLPFCPSFWKTMPDLSSAEDSTIHQLSNLRSIEYGIIGAKYDMEVRADYYRLDDTRHFIMMNYSHSGILFHRSAQKQVLEFLLNGHFSEEQAANDQSR